MQIQDRISKVLRTISEKFWNWNLKDLKLRDVQKEKQLGRFREKLGLEA